MILFDHIEGPRPHLSMIQLTGGLGGGGGGVWGVKSLMLAQARLFYCALTTWYVFAGGWVHGVSFSASGNKLAWVGHDSSISVVNAANECKVATIQGDFLPFAACVWVTENSIITAGNDCSFVIGIIKQVHVIKI